MVRGSSDGTDRWVSSRYSGARFLETYGYRYFGFNHGVGAEGDENAADWYPGSVDGDSPWNRNPMWSDEEDGDFLARYGTSAGNPLILQGTKLQFSVRFTVIDDVLWHGREMVAATIVEALAGANGYAVGAVDEATGITGTGIYSFQSWIDWQNVEAQKVYRHEYDLGLNYEAYEGT